jgi:RNA polymerase sigma factor (sigma-70 family)
MSAILTPVAQLPDAAAHLAHLRPALVKYFLRKCGDASEAEDLAQDVLVRALGKAQWESAEQAKGYIFRIAVNRWHDRNRRGLTHGVAVEWDDSATFAEGVESSPERVLSNEQELHAVIAALEELGERTRDVFMLFRLEQMKHSDIAQLFGISVSAVEKHVAKAVAHLARRAAQQR